MRVHRLIVVETARRLGVPGLAGLGALVAGLLVALVGVWPAQQELERTRIRAAEAEAKKNRIARGEERAQESPSQQLATFYSRLPGQPQVTAWIDRIYAAAGVENLSLDKGEYTLVTDAGGRLSRYQIVLPVHGDYPRVRRFIDTVLASVPHLALDDVSFRRQTIVEPEVEARIRMTLYLTKP